MRDSPAPFRRDQSSYIMNSDVHGYQRRLEHALRSVERSENLSQQDKELIAKFSTVLRIQHLNTGMVAKYDSQNRVWKVMEGEISSLRRPKKTASRTDKGLLFLLFINPEDLGLKFDSSIKLLKRYVATMDGDDSQHYFTADVIYAAPTHWVKQSGNNEYIRLYCGVDPNCQYTDEQSADAMAERIKEEFGGRCCVTSIPVRNSKNAL